MTTAGVPADDDATVAAYDIARLAGVGKAAVSNWRRRHPDFPKPVGGTAASPLYSLAEIEHWLTAHGRSFEVQPADRVWQQIRGTVDDLQLGDLICWIGAAIVLGEKRHGAQEQSDSAPTKGMPELVAEHAPGLPWTPAPHWDAGWAAVVDTAAEAAATQGPRQVFEFLYERYAEVHARQLAVTADHVADLMITLASAGSGTVLDPACGTGGLLLRAAAAGADDVTGREVDPTLARLAALRLALAGAQAQVAATDSLIEDTATDGLADAVVCDPPFAERNWGYDELVNDPRWEYGLPPRGEPELAWVQHCLARVTPGGTAVLMMPAAVANRRAGRRIRSNLLRSGALQAVVALGGGGAVGTPPDLWILRRPSPGQPAPALLLLADAATDPSQAIDAWSAFGSGAPLPESARAVAVVELLDDEVDVGPRRHLRQQPAPAHAADIAELHASVQARLKHLADTTPHLTPTTATPSASTTLGELTRTGMVSLHQAPLKTGDDGHEPVLTAGDIRRGRPATGRGTAGPATVITRRGDVVMALAREPAVRVVEHGGALLGPNLLLLRPDPQRLDPHFLAGFLLAGQQLAAAQSSSGSTRADVHRVALPRLGIAEQRTLGKAFQQLTVFQDTLDEVTARAHDLLRLGFAGLSDGTLRLPPDRH